MRFACHGGCPKDRFIETPDGEAGLNYLCAGYKDFFHHVDRPMRMMSSLLQENRAPSEIVRPLPGRRRAARPQRPVHLRLRPQVEALPRRVSRVELLVILVQATNDELLERMAAEDRRS